MSRISGTDRRGSDSNISESGNFLAKGAFLLTPSYELNVEKATAICEKMNLKSAFSVTKTASGILFKFSNPEDYQALFKKGFHKVTGARFYKKIPIPCRPHETFTVFALEIPEEIPEQDIRHSLYKFCSVLEVSRVRSESVKSSAASKIDSGVGQRPEKSNEGSAPPPAVRITLASPEEANFLLRTGLDFYGATYFPTDTSYPGRDDQERAHRRDSIEDWPGDSVFDAAGFQKIPPSASRAVRPRGQEKKGRTTAFPTEGRGRVGGGGGGGGGGGSPDSPREAPLPPGRKILTTGGRIATEEGKVVYRGISREDIL